MPKRKSAAEILVADAAGGMRRVVDARFDPAGWQLDVQIDAQRAPNWMQHLTAESEERLWSMGGLWQLDPEENSGTITFAMDASGRGIEMTYEKTRRGALRLRLRTRGDPRPDERILSELIEATNARERTNRLTTAHRRAVLTYDGLPWRGELWLDDDTRLGPPSRFPDTLLGPQAVTVDAMVEGIGMQGVNAGFARHLLEVRVFLAALLGHRFAVGGSWERDWIPVIDEQRRVTDCQLHEVGYVELRPEPAFPTRNAFPSVERRTVTRPGLGQLGIWSDMNQQWVPDDAEALWLEMRKLPDNLREQFIRAANAFTVALQLRAEQPTAAAAFLVVACEALKPAGKRYDKANIYDVVRSLAGADAERELRRHSTPPQKVRSRHVHRAELSAGELLPMLIHDYFHDPSFRTMYDDLHLITRICVIEWLRSKGSYRMQPAASRKR